MSTPEDFFAPTGPPRDRHDRPLLFPRGHDPECAECAGVDPQRQPHRKPYTRASTLADYLADFSHITTWKMRYLARSLGYHRDLAMLAAAETYTTGFDQGDLAENRASGRRLDSIIERALDRQGISEKADYGTAVHAWTEPGNDGYVFPDAAADVNSFKQWVVDHGAIILGTEVFTANDDLMSAGTFDHLMWVPGYGIIITDKKTSREVKGSGFRIQLSGYSRSDVYNWETDERQTLEGYVESLGWDPDLINTEVGLIHWIKEGKTTSWRLDLDAGYEWAKIAARVRDEHRKGKHEWPADKDIKAAKARSDSQVLELITNAPTVEALEELWSATTRGAWNATTIEAAKSRRKELES